MPLQDLTPQLRTRLSRVERAVGWFVTLATIALVSGFCYYLYSTAQNKGWFLTKVYYTTSLNNAAGIKEGNPVQLMGLKVGEVTKIDPNQPGSYFGVTITFRVNSPYYGYIWLDSQVKAAPSDFLGNRTIEILKGSSGLPTVWETNGLAKVMTNLVHRTFKNLVDQARQTNSSGDAGTRQVAATNELNRQIMSNRDQFYVNLSFNKAHPFWISPVESPALGDRLDAMATTVENALPGILNLTNQIAAVLSNANTAIVRADATLAGAQPILTNVAFITGNLRDPNGSLGAWLLPTNLQSQLEQTLASANETMRSARQTLDSAHSTIDNTDTNLTTLATQLDLSLANLADMTSNLNAQVVANTNMLSAISKAVVDTDDLVQGLKRHWLLRSAFKPTKTNAPPSKPVLPPKR